eukprot:m.1055465 g.1055465  ORF g.1055465 m.1055465 type:complete len:219 (+) comp24192_c1_seq37:1294-1950(+)
MHPVTLCIFLSWEESAVLVCLNLLPFVLVRMLECLVVGASRIPTVVFNRVQRDVVGVVICCCGGCRTPTEAFRDLVDEHGIMGVYSGFTASLFAAIKPAIHFGIFEQIKKTVLQGARKELGFVESFLYGAIARAISTVVTYPFVRAKVIAQTSKDPTRASMLAIIQEEVAQGGVTGLCVCLVHSSHLSHCASIVATRMLRSRFFWLTAGCGCVHNCLC